MSIVLTDSQARNHIAENVNRLLNARGWNQQQLADEAGENKMNISRICRAACVPTAGLLARIAEALEVTTDDLLAKPK